MHAQVWQQPEETFSLQMKLRGYCFLFHRKKKHPPGHFRPVVLLQQEGVGSHAGSPAHMRAQRSISTLSLYLKMLTLT